MFEGQTLILPAAIALSMTDENEGKEGKINDTQSALLQYLQREALQLLLLNIKLLR